MTARSPTTASDLAARSTSVTSSGKRYRGRNVVERCFYELKQVRGREMRSDKPTRNYHPDQFLAATLHWVRTFGNPSQSTHLDTPPHAGPPDETLSGRPRVPHFCGRKMTMIS